MVFTCNLGVIMLAWLSQGTAFGKGGSSLAPEQKEQFLEVAVGAVEAQAAGRMWHGAIPRSPGLPGSGCPR